MQEFTVNFTKEKDTKNTIRYAEIADGDNPLKIGAIYIQKFAVKELGNPEQISVTVAAIS